MRRDAGSETKAGWCLFQPVIRLHSESAVGAPRASGDPDVVQLPKRARTTVRIIGSAPLVRRAALFALRQGEVLASRLALLSRLGREACAGPCPDLAGVCAPHR